MNFIDHGDDEDNNLSDLLAYYGEGAVAKPGLLDSAVLSDSAKKYAMGLVLGGLTEMMGTKLNKSTSTLAAKDAAPKMMWEPKFDHAAEAITNTALPLKVKKMDNKQTLMVHSSSIDKAEEMVASGKALKYMVSDMVPPNQMFFISDAAMVGDKPEFYPLDDKPFKKINLKPVGFPKLTIDKDPQDIVPKDDPFDYWGKKSDWPEAWSYKVGAKHAPKYLLDKDQTVAGDYNVVIWPKGGQLIVSDGNGGWTQVMEFTVEDEEPDWNEKTFKQAQKIAEAQGTMIDPLVIYDILALEAQEKKAKKMVEPKTKRVVIVSFAIELDDPIAAAPLIEDIQKLDTVQFGGGKYAVQDMHTEELMLKSVPSKLQSKTIHSLKMKLTLPK